MADRYNCYLSVDNSRTDRASRQEEIKEALQEIDGMKRATVLFMGRTEDE